VAAFGGLGTSPRSVPWPCLALACGLGQMPGKVWHVKAISKNGITMNLGLPGICGNMSVTDDEVLRDTAVTGPDKALWAAR